LKRFAFLFPGQGAQYSGMAVDLLSSDSVKKIFDTASEILGKDIKTLLESDADTLKRTDVSQPAITAANLAAAAFLGDKGIRPSACAGFSLGEYAALVCAGVISAADCLRLVRARGEIMQKAADLLCGGDSASAPGMAAVTGLDPETAQNLISKWRDSADSAERLGGLFAANINSPKQLVISGTASALSEAEKRFKEAGAKRVIRLKVAGPFHSPLMEDAQKEFLPALEKICFNDPVMPVFSNVTGGIISSGAKAKQLAAMHITSPVRWTEEETSIAANGIDACLEAGPGKVLQGLWKDSEIKIPVYSAGTLEDINSL